MRKFRIKPQHTDEQQNKKRIRLDDTRQEFLTRRQFEWYKSGVRKRQRNFASIKPRDRASIQLPQQILAGAGDQIDHLVIQRLFFRERLGFRYGLLRQRRISPALLREAA